MYPSRCWRCTKAEAGLCGRALLRGPRLPGLPSEGFPKALGLEVKASGGCKEEELRAGGIYPQGGSASLEVAREVVCPNSHTKVWS